MEGHQDQFPAYTLFNSSSFPISPISLNNYISPSTLEQHMQINCPDLQFPNPSDHNIDDLSTLFTPDPINPISPVSRNVNNGELAGEINVNVSRNKTKLGKKKKYNVPPRVAFHTRSAEDILDDGYKWRKYGQKSVKDSIHPRSYYRCTHHTCNVKKQIQRLSKDTSIVVTTYEGIHNHPCEKLMEMLSPILRQLQFLSRF